MTIWKFKNWCDAAVSGIVFPPDREQVHGELLNHLYDHYDDLVEQGVDKATAEMMALNAMGSAAEIAPQLAAIHRPFWGYFLRCTRIALVTVFCAAVILTAAQLWRTDYHDFSDDVGLHPFDETIAYREFGTYERVFYAEPNQSVHSDGYTITLTKAAVWHRNESDPAPADTYLNSLYFQIEVFNPRPWAEFSDVSRWFWAVDSLGNTYDCYYESIVNYAPYIAGNGYHTGPQTYTHDMWISDYRSEDADWIEFHYDRAGRDLVWRLDLTGGDVA